MRISLTLAILSLFLATTMYAGNIQTNQYVLDVPVGPYTTELELSYASGFIEIPAVKFGWYTQDGLTSPSANYMAGLCNCGVNGATVEVRDFFVFDIPDTFGPFISSTLEVTRGLSSAFPGTANTYRVYDVSPTQIGALLSQQETLALIMTSEQAPLMGLSPKAKSLPTRHPDRYKISGFQAPIFLISTAPVEGCSLWAERFLPSILRRSLLRGRSSARR